MCAWDKTQPADDLDCKDVDDNIRANFEAIEEAFGATTLADGNTIVQGNILHSTAANKLAVLAPGTAGMPLLTGGAGANVSYAQLSAAGISNVFGTWASKTVGTSYQAATDGIVTAYANGAAAFRLTHLHGSRWPFHP